MDTNTDVTEMTTADLVRAFAASRVWFAVNEVTGPTREGKRRHVRHCAVVGELRARGVLDAH